MARKPTWGPVSKERVKRFLQSLLLLEYKKHKSSMIIEWQDEKGDIPEMVVKGKRQDFEELFSVNKYQFSDILDHLEELEIYTDERSVKQGSREWDFTLKLWSKDTEENLVQFDQKWENYKLKNGKSDSQSSILQSPRQAQEEEIHQNKSMKNLKSNKRYDSLIGRDDEIKKICEALAQDNNKIIAIDGIGGIGKTALTCEIAIRSLKEKNFESVVWMSAKSEELTPEGTYNIAPASIKFEDILNRIANELGFSADIARAETIQEKREVVVQFVNQAHNRYLIVIDNLESEDGYKKVVKDLEGLFYPSRAILTTRKRVVFNHVQPFPLSGLQEKESLYFLKKYASQFPESSNIIDDEEKLIQIHTATEGLPLAMELVIGKIAHGYTWETVRRMLRSVNHEVIENPGVSDEDIYQQFYRFIYQDSWEQLSNNAKDLLICLGEFDLAEGAKIDALIESAEIPVTQVEEAASELIQFSLVKRDGVENSQTFRIHSLTHYFVQKDILADQ